MKKAYKIKTSKKVDKFLEKHQKITKRFFEKLIILSKNPYENNLDIIPYEWKKNHFRFRIWKYRFLYEIINDEILIYFYDADTRGDIYK